MTKFYNIKELHLQRGTESTSVCARSKYHWRIANGTEAEIDQHLYVWLKNVSTELELLGQIFGDRGMEPSIEKAYNTITTYRGVVPFGQWLDGSVVEYRFKFLRNKQEMFASMQYRFGHIYLTERPYQDDMSITKQVTCFSF